MATEFRKAYEKRFGVQKGWLMLYDAKGNLIYCEDRKGGWEKFEYDNKGNETYREGYYGRYVKTVWEYDDEGNVTYRKESERGITTSDGKY
jgi:hypothetical protein